MTEISGIPSRFIDPNARLGYVGYEVYQAIATLGCWDESDMLQVAEMFLYFTTLGGPVERRATVVSLAHRVADSLDEVEGDRPTGECV